MGIWRHQAGGVFMPNGPWAQPGAANAFQPKTQRFSGGGRVPRGIILRGQLHLRRGRCHPWSGGGRQSQRQSLGCGLNKNEREPGSLNVKVMSRTREIALTWWPTHSGGRDLSADLLTKWKWLKWESDGQDQISGGMGSCELD